MACRTYRRLTLATCCLAVLTCFGQQTVDASPPVKALLQAHAHNDYLHERPLYDALDHGFSSVEADVFLVDGQLLVAHTRSELSPERTLKNLYLEPLRKKAQAGGGRVWRGGPTLTLLVDVKAEGKASYQNLARLLADYDEIVSGVRDGRWQAKAVTVVVSGDRAKDDIEADAARHVGIDGRLSDLDSDAPSDLLPWISDNWAVHFGWREEGSFPAAERDKLRDIVSRAHRRGRRVRFWATPDEPAVWKELVEADVDVINADNLAGLEQFLRDAAKTTNHNHTKDK